MKRIPKRFVRKLIKQTSEIYKVLWSYEDEVGYDSGVADIRAKSRKEAEREFYKNNRRLYTKDKDGGLVLNNKGGFTCESVLTQEEWKNEGCPTHL